MKRLAIFVYGLIGYLSFLGTFLYAIAFVGGFGIPRTLDSQPVMPTAPAIAIDLGLLALFAVQHSVMARPWFKRWWTKFVPEAAERSTYVLFSSVAMVAIFAFWQPIGGVVWQVQNPTAKAAILSSFAFGWALVFVASLLINHFDLFGMRQVWLYLRGVEYTHPEFDTPGLYRFVRHPLYIGWLMAFWSATTMTAAHLLFSVMTTAYILLAIRCEEHDLKQSLGEPYRKYRESVPMLVPSLAPYKGKPELEVGSVVRLDRRQQA